MDARGHWRIVCAFLGSTVALACGDDAAPPLGGGGDGTAASSDGEAASTTVPSRTDGDPTAPTGAATDGGSTDIGDSSSDSGATAPPRTTGTTTAGDTGVGGTTDTGAPVVHTPVVGFTDVSAVVGIDVPHGEFQTVPNCLVDQSGPGSGGFCIAERMAGASAIGDIDDDGLPDLYFARTYGHDKIYRNQGDGTFVDVAFDLGLVSGDGANGVIFADFDNDGDQDVYLTRLGVTQYELYIRDGGSFSEQAVARGAALKSDIPHSPTGVAVGDYDLDGYLDLYVGEWKTEAGISKEASHSRLLHNLGATAPGHFEDVTDAAGVNIDAVAAQVGSQPGTYAFSPNFADLDGDNHPELTIVSDFRCSRLFWNNGDGTFLDGTVASGAGIDRNGMGSTMGDFDGDGDLDWFITAITQPTGQPENRFFRNVGDRQFVDMAAGLGLGSGGWGWGTTFADVDNDTDLDLMMTAGYYYTSYLEDDNQLWLNGGNGQFGDDIAPAAGLLSQGDVQGRGINAFDYDGDGDLDVFLVNNAGHPNLFRNDTVDAGDWLAVRAVGTISNRDGIGAKVYVTPVLGGPTQYREIGTMTHYVGDPGRDVHFGLGWGEDPIAKIRVYFPASGIERVLTDVDRNQRIEVTE